MFLSYSSSLSNLKKKKILDKNKTKLSNACKVGFMRTFLVSLYLLSLPFYLLFFLLKNSLFIIQQDVFLFC